MGLGIADLADSSTLRLKLVSTEYTEQNGKPVTHLFGRDSNSEFHHVEVVGHSPSFFIREEEYTKRVDNHYAVVRTEQTDSSGDQYEDLHGNNLVRVYTSLPGQVADMRELFEHHYEADVFYTKRFLIDQGIDTGVEIDTSNAMEEDWVRGDMRVEADDISPLDIEKTPDVEPETLTIDIEVAGEEGVPDKDRAEYPVSTIVAGFNGEYRGWCLEADSWTETPGVDVSETGLDALEFFSDESELLHDFNTWVGQQYPDIITGWYSNDFDIPYLYNRCKSLNVYNYTDWSPLEEVFLSKYEPVVKGVQCVDMLEGYKKTQIHKLDSKKLDDIAAKECDASKVELDADNAEQSSAETSPSGEGSVHTEMWRDDPQTFLEYNKRDVELVERIEQAATDEGIIQFLDNLRAIVGCSYTDPIGGNIDMMDTLFLRKAREYGYALPTAEKPDVGDFHGAYVFTPKAGLHEHCVYPDYSGLYPNMMYQCNISPETLIGTAEDLEQSEYDEDDCVWSYIDTATPPALKPDVEASEERMEKVYFLDPDVEEGFIRSVLDDVMGMCDDYVGGLYAAAKRIRNSSYGVLGDSDSYGKGFRLFDWRLAEATTLGGQKVLKSGADTFLDALPHDDAYLVGGDTDSVMTSLPSAESAEDALRAAQSAAEETNEWLEGYTAETFGLASADRSRMELEIETYASRLFFKGADEGNSDEAKKKRYVQLVEWNDDDNWLDEPEMTVKGFEIVRSDIAPITKQVQREIFDALMRENPEDAEERVKEYVSNEISAAIRGERDEDLGVPFGISQDLTEYGDTDHLPMPWYKGAKYANEFIYGGDAIQPGDKPRYWYVQKGATGGLRKTYKAHTKEGGRYVDCISLLDYSDMPGGFKIDRPKQVQKTIIDQIEGIIRTMNWGTEWLYDAKEQATPSKYYRDDDQLSIEDCW